LGWSGAERRGGRAKGGMPAPADIDVVGVGRRQSGGDTGSATAGAI
jgi:hypothetical protein